jgi:hypothetical protein
VNTPLSVPIDIGRDPAAAAARRELSKSIYQVGQPSLPERVLAWVLARIESAFGAVGVSGGLGLVFVVVLVGIVIGLIMWRVGPLRRAASGSGEPIFVDRSRSAAEHRTAAETAAQRGEWADAVRERFRAIVATLEERDLLDARPGRTADEVASEGGRVLPDSARDLAAVARLFDDIVYGEGHADQRAYATVRELDEHLRHSRPMLAPELVR